MIKDGDNLELKNGNLYALYLKSYIEMRYSKNFINMEKSILRKVKKDTKGEIKLKVKVRPEITLIKK